MKKALRKRTVKRNTIALVKLFRARERTTIYISDAEGKALTHGLKLYTLERHYRNTEER